MRVRLTFPAELVQRPVIDAHRELGRTKIRPSFPKTDDMLIEAGRRLQKLAR